MKVKFVYGAPCSGKSTYVKSHAGEQDLVFDYDKLLMACTNRTVQSLEKHPMASFILRLRKLLIDTAKNRSDVENLYITSLWVGDNLRSEIEGLDFEEIFIEASKEECFEHLENDKERPDKGAWKMLINDWFNKHAADGIATSQKTQNFSSPHRFWNFIRNSTTGKRELRLDGAISDVTWLGDEITPNAFRQELESAKGDITVWINSPGGDVFAATAIYNMLRQYKGNVTIKIDGIAASAASIVAMAGDTVEISPIGQIMIHNPETVAKGSAIEFSAAIKMLEEVKEGIINAYEFKTKLPRSQIAKMMDDETWLNAKKAVELGFADKILFSENQAQNNLIAKSFSQTAVLNSLAQAFNMKRQSFGKIPQSKGIKVASLRRRLKLIGG